MIATFLNELFAAAVATLPRLFLLGAPVLLLAIVLAALADWKLGNAGVRGCAAPADDAKPRGRA
jgi:hypothetical protein